MLSGYCQVGPRGEEPSLAPRVLRLLRGSAASVRIPWDSTGTPAISPAVQSAASLSWKLFEPTCLFTLKITQDLRPRPMRIRVLTTQNPWPRFPTDPLCANRKVRALTQRLPRAAVFCGKQSILVRIRKLSGSRRPFKCLPELWNPDCYQEGGKAIWQPSLNQRCKHQ